MNSLQASKSLSNGLEFTVQSFMRAPLKTALASWAPSINIIIIIIIVIIIIIIIIIIIVIIIIITGLLIDWLHFCSSVKNKYRGPL